MRVKNINIYKSYAAAGIFLLLTVLKLVLPGQSQALRVKILELINRSDDYTEYVEMIQTLGSRVSESRLAERLVRTFGHESDTYPSPTPSTPSPEPVLLRESSDSISPSPTPEPIPEPTPEPTPDPTPEPAPTPSPEPSVSEREGDAVPANVRTDMPEIPFEYTSPVAGYESSGFGYRMHPLLGEMRFHYGTDYAADMGESVAAFADGYVYAAGESEGYGKYLILTHEGGFASLYAHLSEFVAHEGDMVSCGETIGRVGQSGNATGPHLHFELFLNDVYINPEYYV